MTSKSFFNMSKTVKRAMALMPKKQESITVYKKMMIDAERTEQAVKNRRFSESPIEKDTKENTEN